MKEIAWLGAVAALLLRLPAAVAQGGEEDDLAMAYGDKSTVSIATGTTQPLRRAPAVASVVTAEDIAAMGATDLDQVMESIPGVHVGRSANNYSPLYLIRGIYSQYNAQTLMLVNGVPMTTLLVGSRGNIWGGLPLENVARIEVIRGPGSALYGADAFAGVINIVTKTAAHIQGTQVGVRLGDAGTRDAWVLHGGSVAGADVSAYFRVGAADSDGEIVAADAQTRLDRLFGTRASLAPGAVNLGRKSVDASLTVELEKWRLNAGYKQRDGIGTGAGIASALDPNGKGGSSRFHADLTWSEPHLAEHWAAGASISYMRYVQQIHNPLQLLPAGANAGGGVFGPQGALGVPLTWEDQVRMSATAIFSGFADHKLRIGIGHDDLDMYRTAEHRNFTYSAAGNLVPIGALTDFSATAPFIRPHRRKVDYVYVQDEWNFAKDWTLTAGIRSDRFSDVVRTTNPRLALIWDATYSLTTKMLYGAAFRAPSFAELYSVTNPVNAGNSQLRPEKIRSLEWSASWQARPGLQLNAGIYRYTITDLILAVTNPTANTGSTYQNTGGRDGRGMEVEGVWDATRNLRLTANYSQQRSLDVASGTDTGYAPRHHVYARGDWRFASGWLVGAQLNRVAGRKRAVGDQRSEVPDYTTLDLNLRSERGRNEWSFSAALRNLFNNKVYEPSLAPGTALPSDLPQARRSFHVQADYRM